MKQKLKDRLTNAVVILVFLALLAGSGYYILKTMTTWRVKGLGF